MKNYFVKQTHTNFKALFGIIFFVFLIFVVIISVRKHSFNFNTVIFILAILILSTFISLILDKFGLYINGNGVFFQKIRRKEIDISEINAIKIIQSEIDGKYGRRAIKNIHGKQMHSMIFLKSVQKNMKDYEHEDTTFVHEFKDDILFCTVFDKKVLEYFKTKKDNLVIF